MSTQIDLGPVLSIPKGDWNADTTYERLNLVRHNAGAWICKVATSKGVEPTETSTDWFLQVKDTSAVTSVNGQRGDVELYNINTPAETANSTEIVNAEWVNNKVIKDLTATKEELESTITEQVDSAKDHLEQYTNSTVSNAVSGISASLKDMQTELETTTTTLNLKNTYQDFAIDDKVSRTEADEIRGLKTFIENPMVKNTGPAVHLNNTTFKQGENPSSDTYWAVNFNDDDSTRNGRIQHYVNKNGQTGTMLETRSVDNTVSHGVGVVIYADGTSAGVAPTTPVGAKDEEIITADYLASSNSNVVHRSGNETIAGAKTFTADITIHENNPVFYGKCPLIEKGTSPSTNRYTEYVFQDKNGESLALVTLQQRTNGENRAGLRAFKNKAGSSSYAEMNVVNPSSGSPYATAPSTPAGSTGNQVITADYLDSTGTYSPTSLPFIDLPDTSAHPYENNMDKVRTPGRYHVRWDSTTSGAPIAGLADAIVEVVRVGSAGSISSYARLLQVVYVVGKSDNANRVFWRRTKPEYGGSFADWVEVVLNSFDGNLVFTNTGPTNAYVNIKNNAVTAGVIPTSNRLSGIKMLDATGTAIGQCRTEIAKDGRTNTSIIAYSPDGTKNGSIAINYRTDGTFVGTAPTPAADSNTTHIATTAWVRGKGVLVESWHSGANWYRKYSDGWIEQGGFVKEDTLDTPVTYHVAFADTNYWFTSCAYPYATDASGGDGHKDRTTTGCTILHTAFYHNPKDGGAYWYACGY